MQIALGAAGAAIGFAIGGIPGAQIGWMVGSFVGGLLDPPKNEGPRRTDLKVQHSSYGSPIPYYWGRVRGAGIVIWQPEEMTEHSHTSGGKGGPKQTTYTYSISFAIMLCAAKRFGEPAALAIKRIWADGRLVSEDGQPTDELPFVFYDGSEDQLPDPTIEADKGAGNVPAYRGYALVVFTELYLTDYGDRIPSFEFEIQATQGNDIQTVWEFDEPLPYLPVGGSTAPVDGAYVDGGQLVVCTYNPEGDENHYTETRYSFATGEYLSVTNTDITPHPAGIGSVIRPANNSDIAAVLAVDGILNQQYWLKAGAVGALIQNPPGVDDHTANAQRVVQARPYVYEDYIYAPAEEWVSGHAHIYKWGIGDGGWPVGEANEEYYDITANSVFHSGSSLAALNVQISFDDEGYLYVMHVGTGVSAGRVELHKVNAEDMTLVTHWTLSEADLDGFIGALHFSGEINRQMNAGTFTVYRGILAFYGNLGVEPAIGLFRLTEPGSPSALPFLDAEVYTSVPALAPGWVDLGNGYILLNAGLYHITGDETLGQVVEDLSVLAGFDTSQVDVTDLPDPVPGFRIASQMVAKNAIEALRQVYFFDGAEVDEQIVFSHRDHSSVVEIPTSDLAAHEHGSEPPPTLEVERVPDHELPRRVNVTFNNPENDYQASTQYDERQTGGSVSDVSIDTPVIMNDDFARSIAAVHVFVGLIERETAKIFTTRKYEWLVANDVIVVEDRQWRIVNKRAMKAGVIEFTLKPTKASIFDQPANVPGLPAGTNGNNGGGTGGASTKCDTEAILLDIPLLSQGDSQYGFYVAGAPNHLQSGTWPGFTLYKSLDGGVTYKEVASSSVVSTMGITDDALGNYTGNLEYIDTTNYIDITIRSGEDEIVSTNATGLANGQNLCAIRSGSGWELLQFQDAVYISDGRIRIYNLVRGVKDTAAYISGHAAGDDFVLLPVTNVSAPREELNVPLYYKAVTWGKSLSSATPILFTNTGTANDTYVNDIIDDVGVFNCDFGSPGGTRAGFVPAPTMEDCDNDRILSVHGWVDPGTGSGSVTVEKEGVSVATGINILNFVGTPVTVIDSGGGRAAVVVTSHLHTKQDGATVDATATTVDVQSPLIATDIGGGVTEIAHDVSGVAVGTYSNATISVDLQGHVINISTGTGGSPWIGIAPYGTGEDGAADFDGTNTYAFATKTGNSYALNRSVALSSCIVRNGCELITANFQYFCSGNTEVEAGGALHNDGPASTSFSGATERASQFFAANGSNGASGSQTAAPLNSTSIVRSVGNPGGTGGSSPAGVGSNGGACTIPGANTGGVANALTPYALQYGVAANQSAQFTIGTGGGGARGEPGVPGGGGGAPGGKCVVFSRTVSGSGRMSSNGGDSWSPTAGTDIGSGGGGAGGLMVLVTTSASHSLTVTADGGLPGTPRGTGTAGQQGGAGRVFEFLG